MNRSVLKLISILLVPVFCYITPRIADRLTDGFRHYEILSDIPNRKDWEVTPLSLQDQNLVDGILLQPFYYLGKGDQCYAFISKDQKYVLKFFKHDHLSPEHLVKNSFLKKLFHLRTRYLDNVFNSCKIAYEELKEETGLLYVHLNKTNGRHKLLTFYDKIGILHTIDLDATEFVLQKKADQLFSTLNQYFRAGDTQEVKYLVQAVINNIMSIAQKGFRDTDTSIRKNMGFIQNRAVFIDVGSFVKDDSLKDPALAKLELIKKTERLKEWIEKHHPEFSNEYQALFLKVIEQKPLSL